MVLIVACNVSYDYSLKGGKQSPPFSMLHRVQVVGGSSTLLPTLYQERNSNFSHRRT